ncbi:MAG TPA: tetratricopeptide repeat protein [Alphaproteobacteria bacterium]|nr:tetratricopeptide repeat protein [Alphaproteobacteria bacterium]
MHINDTLIREFDEAMKQERLLEVWHKFRWYIIGLVTFIVLAVAGWQGWQAWQLHQARSMAERYYAWTKLPEKEQQAKLPELLQRSTQGYRALIVFKQAQEQGKTDAVAADRTYALVYGDRGQPQWLREMARLNAAIILLGRNDTLAQEHLSVLAQQPEEAKAGPAYPAALELLAMLAIRQGDTTTANGYLNRMVALPNLPADSRARARLWLGAYSTLAK